MEDLHNLFIFWQKGEKELLAKISIFQAKLLQQCLMGLELRCLVPLQGTFTPALCTLLCRARGTWGKGGFSCYRGLSSFDAELPFLAAS